MFAVGAPLIARLVYLSTHKSDTPGPRSVYWILDLQTRFAGVGETEGTLGVRSRRPPKEPERG